MEKKPTVTRRTGTSVSKRKSKKLPIESTTFDVAAALKYLGKNIQPLTNSQIETLTSLTYNTKSNVKRPIITTDRRDVFIEILGMIVNHGYDFTLDFLMQASKPDDILWNQPALDTARVSVLREITIQTIEKVGITTIGNCPFCGSRELRVDIKQISSGDEGSTAFYSCVNCNKRWNQR